MNLFQKQAMSPEPPSLEELTVLTGARLIGGSPDMLIMGAADVQDAGPQDLVFAERAAFLQRALASQAAVILTRSELAEGASFVKPLLLVENPRLAFVQVLERLAPPLLRETGVHPTAFLGEHITLGESVSIGAFVTVGEAARIGDRVTIMDGARIGAGCVIGNDTVLYPNVVLYPCVKIGNSCLLHAGVVLGADGFGYVPVGQMARKTPHTGSVEIGDMVEIGANSCVDRARTGVTSIGAGTKIDNLVHVAHNVHIGRSCLLAAMTGIAGSTEIGDGVIFAGQSGAVDHVVIGDGVTVGAQSGITKNVAAGASVSGFPARSHRAKLREYAALAVLPEALKQLKALEHKMNPERED